jgi:hypothetical protein
MGSSAVNFATAALPPVCKRPCARARRFPTGSTLRPLLLSFYFIVISFSYNEQLTQSLQKSEKELKSIEEKHHRQLNESQTSHTNEINEFKRRIEQLENENEQLRREEIVHVEPTSPTHIQTMTLNNEEREELEKEIEEYKKKIDNLQVNFLTFYSF